MTKCFYYQVMKYLRLVMVALYMNIIQQVIVKVKTGPTELLRAIICVIPILMMIIPTS